MINERSIAGTDETPKSVCIFRNSGPPTEVMAAEALRHSPEESSNLQQVQVISSTSSLIIYPFL